MVHNFRRLTFLAIFSLLLGGSGCSTLSESFGLSARIKTVDTVQVPFMKNSANECYFLDEYMPTPDNLVNGRSGRLRLRYYTYKAAAYKDWDQKQIVLSFYSFDDRCWSLFEEYYVDD